MVSKASWMPFPLTSSQDPVPILHWFRGEQKLSRESRYSRRATESGFSHTLHLPNIRSWPLFSASLIRKYREPPLRHRRRPLGWPS